MIVRRSRRARRWTLRVPWGESALLTVPSRLPEREVRRLVEQHRAWIAAERAK